MLYRFRLDVSDVDRGVYETLDFRLAMHPSETVPFLLTRVLAYGLNWQDGLAFAPGGLSDDEKPALSVTDPRGGHALWIEVGSPSTKRLHKAAKASKAVKVYVHRDPTPLLREIAAAGVYKADTIEIVSFDSGFLDKLAVHLERDNDWQLLVSDGALTVSVGGESIATELTRRFGSEK